MTEKVVDVDVNPQTNKQRWPHIMTVFSTKVSFMWDKHNYMVFFLWDLICLQQTVKALTLQLLLTLLHLQLESLEDLTEPIEAILKRCNKQQVLYPMCVTLCLAIRRRHKVSRDMRKPTMWFLTRSDTNQAVQLLEMARGLKFCT